MCRQELNFNLTILELKAVTSSEQVAIAKESPVELRKIARKFAEKAIEKVIYDGLLTH